MTVDWTLLASFVFVKSMLLPFVGIGGGTATYLEAFKSLFSIYHFIPEVASLGIVFGLGFLVIRSKDAPLQWLFWTFVIVVLLTYLGAWGNREELVWTQGGLRYSFVPMTILVLIIFGLAMVGPPGVQVAFKLLLVLILVAGLKSWKLAETGPSWAAEVAHWRQDPSHMIVLWPSQVLMCLPPRYGEIFPREKCKRN